MQYLLEILSIYRHPYILCVTKKKIHTFFFREKKIHTSCVYEREKNKENNVIDMISRDREIENELLNVQK